MSLKRGAQSSWISNNRFANSSGANPPIGAGRNHCFFDKMKSSNSSALTYKLHELTHLLLATGNRTHGNRPRGPPYELCFSQTLFSV